MKMLDRHVPCVSTQSTPYDYDDTDEIEREEKFDRIFGLAAKLRAEAESLFDDGLCCAGTRRSFAADCLHDFFGDFLPDDITAPKSAITERKPGEGDAA
jgi:hypothetical protein